MATKIEQRCDCELLCENCGMCLKNCCECCECSDCGGRVDTNNDYWCSNCEKCENCDECRTCENCDERVSSDDYCGECDCCHECCSCTFCTWCGEQIDTDEEYCEVHTNHPGCCRKIAAKGLPVKTPCKYSGKTPPCGEPDPPNSFDLNPEEVLE